MKKEVINKLNNKKQKSPNSNYKDINIKKVASENKSSLYKKEGFIKVESTESQKEDVSLLKNKDAVFSHKHCAVDKSFPQHSLHKISDSNSISNMNTSCFIDYWNHIVHGKKRIFNEKSSNFESNFYAQKDFAFYLNSERAKHYFSFELNSSFFPSNLLIPSFSDFHK